MSNLVGLDINCSCTPENAKKLKENAYQFLGRYYSRTTKIPGKKLTRGEAVAVCQAGLQLVAVYEDGPTSYAYFSANRGTADAEGAMEQAEAVGQPEGTAIYFTVD